MEKGIGSDASSNYSFGEPKVIKNSQHTKKVSLMEYNQEVDSLPKTENGLKMNRKIHYVDSGNNLLDQEIDSISMISKQFTVDDKSKNRYKKLSIGEKIEELNKFVQAKTWVGVEQRLQDIRKNFVQQIDIDENESDHTSQNSEEIIAFKASKQVVLGAK